MTIFGVKERPLLRKALARAVLVGNLLTTFFAGVAVCINKVLRPINNEFFLPLQLLECVFYSDWGVLQGACLCFFNSAACFMCVIHFCGSDGAPQ